MALAGIRVVEMAGLAPAPFCGMILADYGAQVIRVDRAPSRNFHDRLTRGKRSIAVNLKSPEGINIVKRLCSNSDVLIEPYRPGVMEKLGLGPQVLMSENPRLIYARLTGYGQTGPYKSLAGHDINYLATSGLLSLLGRTGDKPYAPINLVADFAGGGLLCAFRILMAVLERGKTNRGKLIDASMVEGAAYVGSWLFTSRDLDIIWGKERGSNMLDGGGPIYDTYRTKDGKFVAVGAIEPQFHNELFQKLELELDTGSLFEDPERVRKLLTDKFASKTRDEWASIFASSDACVSPVLELAEVADDTHNKFRKSFPRDQHLQSVVPAPEANHFRDQSVQSISSPAQHTRQILRELGIGDSEIDELVKREIVEADDAQRSKL